MTGMIVVVLGLCCTLLVAYKIKRKVEEINLAAEEQERFLQSLEEKVEETSEATQSQGKKKKEWFVIKRLLTFNKYEKSITQPFIH